LSSRAKLKGALWLALAVGLAAGIAEEFTVFARMVPFSTEQKIATAINFGESANACKRPDGERALQKLVERLYPIMPDDAEIQINVTAVHNPEVNAYATLGGQVFINQGLIEQAASPEELAGVLAHEIEHVRRRHVLENVMVRLGTWGAMQLVMGDAPDSAELAQMILGIQYGKGQEHEADVGGLERLAQAEVSAKGFLVFFKRMRQRSDNLDFLSDHPSDASRAALAETYLGRKSRPVLDAAEWAAIRGMCK
jgi:predicted Zn-dependent protease